MASSYSKTSVFDRQHVNEKPVKGVSFWKDAFLVTVFTRYVRTAGQTGEKKSHLKVETNTSLCGRGIKNGCFQISPFVFGYHGRFPFNISEISQWNDTFRLHRPDPSHRTFGYCSCKQDTKERYWGQQFCQMERDISVRLTEMTRPVKVDHLQSWSRIFRSDQTEMVCSICCTNHKFGNFGLNGKCPLWVASTQAPSHSKPVEPTYWIQWNPALQSPW